MPEPITEMHALEDGNNWTLADHSLRAAENKGPGHGGYFGVTWMLGSLSYAASSQTVVLLFKFLFLNFSLKDHSYLIYPLHGMGLRGSRAEVAWIFDPEDRPLQRWERPRET